MSDMDRDGMICFAESLEPDSLGRTTDRIVDFVLGHMNTSQIIQRPNALEMAIAALGSSKAAQLPVVDRLLICHLEDREEACGWFVSIYAGDLPTSRVFFDGPLGDLRQDVTSVFEEAVNSSSCDLCVRSGSRIVGKIPAVYTWAMVRANSRLRKGLERRGIVRPGLTLRKFADGVQSLLPERLAHQDISVCSWTERGFLRRVESETILHGAEPHLARELSEYFAAMLSED
jgi:hypothetical protein